MKMILRKENATIKHTKLHANLKMKYFYQTKKNQI